MTRIVAISDTHTYHRQMNVPDGDILIHAGDFSFRGGLEELSSFNSWLKTLPHRHILLCAGNHDYTLDVSHPGYIEKALDQITTGQVITHGSVTVEGLKIFMSSWTPEFHNWGFNYPPSEAAKLWSHIPNDIDILVTHGPAYGILDELDQNGSMPGLHVGCPELLAAINRVRPKHHVCGHIHEGYGTYKGVHTTFHNVSMLDSRYRTTNPATVIDL
mgnify:CR=1 FL=1